MSRDGGDFAGRGSNAPSVAGCAARPSRGRAAGGRTTASPANDAREAWAAASRATQTCEPAQPAATRWSGGCGARRVAAAPCAQRLAGPAPVSSTVLPSCWPAVLLACRPVLATSPRARSSFAGVRVGRGAPPRHDPVCRARPAGAAAPRTPARSLTSPGLAPRLAAPAPPAASCLLQLSARPNCVAGRPRSAPRRARLRDRLRPFTAHANLACGTSTPRAHLLCATAAPSLVGSAPRDRHPSCCAASSGLLDAPVHDARIASSPTPSALCAARGRTAHT